MAADDIGAMASQETCDNRTEAMLEALDIEADCGIISKEEYERKKAAIVGTCTPAESAAAVVSTHKTEGLPTKTQLKNIDVEGAASPLHV